MVFQEMKRYFKSFEVILFIAFFKVKEVYLTSLDRHHYQQLMKKYSLLSEGVTAAIISGELYFNVET